MRIRYDIVFQQIDFDPGFSAMAEKDAGVFQFEKMLGHIGTIVCPDEKGIFGGCA